jgi:hypothetical protein
MDLLKEFINSSKSFKELLDEKMSLIQNKLVESVIFERNTENTIKEKFFNGGKSRYNEYFELYINPTTSELNDCIKNSRQEPRGYIDKDGNLYLAKSDSALHRDIFSLIEEKTGKTVNYENISESITIQYKNNEFFLGESISNTELRNWRSTIEDIIKNYYRKNSNLPKVILEKIRNY